MQREFWNACIDWVMRNVLQLVSASDLSMSDDWLFDQNRYMSDAWMLRLRSNQIPFRCFVELDDYSAVLWRKRPCRTI